MTVLDIYQQTIKPLSTTERLQLARLILNDIPPQAVVDYREDWTEEDYRDFSKASWDHINRALEEEENGQTG